MRRLVLALLVALCVALVARTSVRAQTGYCGDGTCQTDGCPIGGPGSPGNGCEEDSSNCEADCSFDPYSVQLSFPPFNFPYDGPDLVWGQYWYNYPDEDQVGGCFGNCGPGCSQWDVCGTPTQYWEWQSTSGPEYTQEVGYYCLGNDQYYGTVYQWRRYGTWTYHGWDSDGCAAHDASCRDAAFFWLCYPPSSWLMGGACLNAGPAQWSYSATLKMPAAYQGTLVAANACWSGGPICGDGICETQECYTGGGGSPGNGCEETLDNCSDCQ